MNLKHRINRLEKTMNPPAGPVIGVSEDGGPVKIGATGEELPLAVFYEKYPHSTVIEWRWDDGPS